MITNIFNYVCYINRKYQVIQKLKIYEPTILIQTLKIYEPTILNVYATYKGLKLLRII
jgi:hypothetical protein